MFGFTLMSVLKVTKVRSFVVKINGKKKGSMWKRKDQCEKERINEKNKGSMGKIKDQCEKARINVKNKGSIGKETESMERRKD